MGCFITIVVVVIIIFGTLYGLISLSSTRNHQKFGIAVLNSNLDKNQNFEGTFCLPSQSLDFYHKEHKLSKKMIINSITEASIKNGKRVDLNYLGSISQNRGPYNGQFIISTKEEIRRTISRINNLKTSYSEFQGYETDLEKASNHIKQQRIKNIVSIDIDKDGVFGFNDLLVNLGIKPTEFESFSRGLFLVNDDIAFIFPNSKFNIKISPELIDLVKYCGKVPFNMTAHYIYGILDVNTDGFISIVDDVNQDNCIDKRDFDDIRRYRKNLVNKFGTDMNQSKITINDIIFERYFIVKNSEFSRAIPSANLFKPYFHRSSEFSEPVIVERHFETNTTSGSGALGAGIGAGLGGLLFGPLGAIAGGLLGCGLDSMPVETTNEHETIKKIEYITTKIEKQEPVFVCIVTCVNGYKVFFFDASHVITEVEERRIIEQHINGQLVNSPSSEFISKRGWSRCNQETSGRIMVLDPKRDLRASFDKNGLVGIFYTKDGIRADGVMGKALEKDFKATLLDLISGPLSRLNGLVYSLHHFNGSSSLWAQDKYLSSLDDVKFSNPDGSLLDVYIFRKASNH